MIDVHDEQDIGQRFHFLDAAKTTIEFLTIAIEPKHLFFREAIKTAFRGHLFEHHEAFHGLTNRFVIREHATQPALVDVGHFAALGMIANCVARSALGADKEHGTAIGNGCLDERGRFLRQRQAPLKVDDMDFVTLAEDVRCHLRVPVTGLMTKMHASL